MTTLRIGDTEAVESFYYGAFKQFQQVNCRVLATEWVDIIEPRKQVKYPYKRGRGPRPPWWPQDIQYREPAHQLEPR